jgi:hypothetical protein
MTFDTYFSVWSESMGITRDERTLVPAATGAIAAAKWLEWHDAKKNPGENYQLVHSMRRVTVFDPDASVYDRPATTIYKVTGEMRMVYEARKENE